MHHSNGLYFQRGINGDVAIVYTNDDTEPRMGKRNAEGSWFFSEEEWAKVVAAVSLAGDTGKRVYKAMTFHSEPVDTLEYAIVPD